MKETLLDVLLYLFENYFYDDPAAVRDRDSLQAGLIQAGFSPAEASKAFDWLDGLDQLRTPCASELVSLGPLRVYALQEQARLDLDCRGFLLFLEQNGILDGALREQVIDRAMALDQPELDLDDLKWVVLMVLFNQPGREAAFAWMESHIFALDGAALH
jgi:Smg protein